MPGAHVPSTGTSRVHLSIAGAYWRGDEKNRMLQRIYGTAFGSPKRSRLPQLPGRGEEARPPQARQGPSCSCCRGGGARPRHHMPKGGRLRSLIEEFSCILAGYDIVYGPSILRAAWEISGHMDNF